MYKYLETYNNIEDLKKMSKEELKGLSLDIREFLIDKVSKTGGHLASNLGVVELTIALHKFYNFKKDKLIFDVGHQSYVHKILTGRKDKFDSLRKYNGLSGFPKRDESIFDHFETGHSSTSISAASGMARARDILKENYNVVAVIGDGALTGGMALEALNDAGFKKTKITVILNDNNMSIAKNVGGISAYLNQLRSDPAYTKFKKNFNSALEKSAIGNNIASSINKIKSGIKSMVVPGMFFESMGVTYLGPVDGHNINEVMKVLESSLNVDGPCIIHVNTVKGRGYQHAEDNPGKFHGVSPFYMDSGKIISKPCDNYSKVFGSTLVEMAKEDKNIVAVTAAMPDGTGLLDFSKYYPDRFFDVGIAEEHAVTMCAGMASSGLKPYFAVYSTFLQRGFDQILHDVCIQNLPVTFAIDRAGLVGSDGETHQGIFDISYLSVIPNMTIISPKSMDELKLMLKYSKDFKSPLAIRYPRGKDKVSLPALKEIKYGKWEYITKAGDIAIIATGIMVQHAFKAKELLEKEGIEVAVINGCFIKPLDTNALDYISKRYKYVVTVEDNLLNGGFGLGILSYLNIKNYKGRVINLGFCDEFIPHGDTKTLYKINNIDENGIKNTICEILKGDIDV